MSVFNRAEAIDQNFIKSVKQGRFSAAKSQTSLSEAGLRSEDFLDLVESQMMSRQLDLRARILKNDNQCFYTIGSSGHEGNAGYAKVFSRHDMAFLHYRSGAFMIQRSKHLPSSTPLYDTLLSFVASKDDPIAGGRHKVFGSYPLLVPPQTSTIASHLPKAVGAALSITRARDLRIAEAKLDPQSVVLCSFGDASANHSTAVGAINMACWIAYQGLSLPLVFVCEDNQIGISVATPNGWIENTYAHRKEMPYVYCDGLNLCDVVAAGKEAEELARVRKKPVFLHMKTVRLIGHAGSDVETSYRSMGEIEETEAQDPLLHSARIIREYDLLSSDGLLDMYRGIGDRIEQISKYVITRPKITDPREIAETIVSCQSPRKAPSVIKEPERERIFDREFSKLSTPQHLAKLINWGLTDLMLQYRNTLVFGEDVAQKGGVYNVTEGLFKKFGPKRVFNSLLDEQSIIGTAIGMAHNGFLPIAEIQFVAYFHNAEDQIRGEAATLAFFSKGQFTNPMVLRIAGLPYQKGFGGHFHNDNSLAVFRDIPGIVIAIPSRGDDAVKMLRTCVREAYENGRVVIFIEPIALYMTKDLHLPNDKEWSFNYPAVEEEIPFGQFGVHGEGKDLLIITYGNGTYYSMQAQKILKDKFGFSVRVLDLRWIAPIDMAKITEEAKKCDGVLVVDECRKTGSLSEFIVSGLVEHWEQPKSIQVLAADDCFIPLGVAAASGLPSRDQIVERAKNQMMKIRKKR